MKGLRTLLSPRREVNYHLNGESQPIEDTWKKIGRRGAGKIQRKKEMRKKGDLPASNTERRGG